MAIEEGGFRFRAWTLATAAVSSSWHDNWRWKHSRPQRHSWYVAFLFEVICPPLDHRYGRPVLEELVYLWYQTIAHKGWFSSPVRSYHPVLTLLFFFFLHMLLWLCAIKIVFTSSMDMVRTTLILTQLQYIGFRKPINACKLFSFCLFSLCHLIPSPPPHQHFGVITYNVTCTQGIPGGSVHRENRLYQKHAIVVHRAGHKGQ